MDGEGEDEMGENAVNRQTALLSLDVLARVLGRRHQDAFIGVLDDVTHIVAGEGPGALPGERSMAGRNVPVVILFWPLACRFDAMERQQALARLRGRAMPQRHGFGRRLG